MKDVLAQHNTTAMVRGMKLPEPSETLTKAKNELNELIAQRDALQADHDNDNKLIKADIKALAQLSRDEQEALRKIAVDPDDRERREKLDEIRGAQLVTKDSLEHRKSLNQSRTEMVVELNKQIAVAVKRARSCTNGYYQDLYKHFESELVGDVKPLLEKLAALRLMAGMRPTPEVVPDITTVDSLAAEIRTTLSNSYGI